ncbi:MAG TPA: NupC/NupG family nucleoside CNT transporter [Cyanobacteria bacterium UBA8530]|nr:NupC/NupG family nucleoside CNT transporter [Cyanobacteria bacterium UBA8530]
MQNIISIFGLLAILGLGVLFSSNRKAIRPRIILWGLGLQLGLALFILKTQAGKAFFTALGALVTKLLDFTKVGAGFVFGNLVNDSNLGFIFAFQVLPTIVFVGALMGIFYYLGIMQVVISFIAKIMVKTMGTSGAESLSAVGCVFVGQSEAPLLIRPYIADMTRSELMAIMTGGMATIAGSVMAAYIGMGIPASHLLAASIMGAPAGLVMAKLLVPETEESKTKGAVSLTVERTESNVIEAAAKGAADGMHLAFNVGAMLIAFIALIAMLNSCFHLLGFGITNFAHLLGAKTFVLSLSIETILGWVFSPLAFFMGVPFQDVTQMGALLGQKIVLNEFVAYSQLSSIIAGTSAIHLQPRTITIATYALCGFANFSSVAMNIGGIGAMAPSRRGDLAQLGLKAMMGGALASCLTATIAGILS